MATIDFPALATRCRDLNAVAALLSLILLFPVGCSKQREPTTNSSTPSTSPSPTVAAEPGPKITASPNPVPAGPGKGVTTVSWDTGDKTIGEVYVSVNGGQEKRFAGDRPKGSQDAAWIGKGEYEFRLYAGKERTRLLSTVKVTRAK